MKTLQYVIEEHCISAYIECNYNELKTADFLAVSRSTLRKYLRSYEKRTNLKVIRRCVGQELITYD